MCYNTISRKCELFEGVHTVIKKIILRSLAVLGTTLAMIIILLYCVMWICVNGPSTRAKELFVLSVRETSAVGFLANIYCSNAEIERIESAQKVQETIVVDTSLIKTDEQGSHSTGLTDNPSMDHPQGTPGTDKDSNGEEKQDDNGLEFIPISGPTYKGILLVVKDPSRVMVGTSSPQYSEAVPGKKVVDMIASYGAVAGTNAGGFQDPQGAGNGGTPIGIVISEGELRYGSLSTSYELIGMNKDNILIVGTMTGKQALDAGVRDAVSFGPVLVANGVPTKASQGGGLNPRTAIGQRSDGAILLMVIDGRQSSSLGASYTDVTQLMMDYGAVNAANLDGGSSSVMYYEGELLNSCSSLYGPREMPTCIIVK